MFDWLSSYIPKFTQPSSQFQKQFNDFLSIFTFKAGVGILGFVQILLAMDRTTVAGRELNMSGKRSESASSQDEVGPNEIVATHTYYICRVQTFWTVKRDHILLQSGGLLLKLYQQP